MQDDQLGRALVAGKHLAADALTRALRLRDARGEPLDRVLLAERLVPEPVLVQVLAAGHRMEVVDLAAAEKDVAAVAILPYELCARLGVAPVELDGDVLTVAIADPRRYVPVERAVQEATKRRVRIRLAAPSALEAALDRCYGGESGEDFEIVGVAPQEAGDEDEAEDASAIATVNRILAEALARRASDIHLEPAETHVQVRYRVDGVLHDVTRLPADLQRPVAARIKVISNLDIGERRLPQDGNVRVRARGRGIDFRVSILPNIHGERVVMRVLDAAQGPQSLADIGFEADTRERFERALVADHGIILVTGPTGSGKTSTLYAALRHMMDPSLNIMTVEDPVEYKLEGVSQTQVHAKIGFDFAKVLESFLRQDPDVILVGEIRNEETANIAVRASLTGHRVLSTLHMHSAAEALTRMVEMGIKPYAIGSTLRAVLAQRLVRRVCPGCVTPDEASRPLAQKLGIDPGALVHGAGCGRCARTGFHGRLALTELLVVDERIRDAIVSGATAQDVARLARENGMRTLAESALAKVAAGETSVGETLSYFTELL